MNDDDNMHECSLCTQKVAYADILYSLTSGKGNCAHVREVHPIIYLKLVYKQKAKKGMSTLAYVIRRWPGSFGTVFFSYESTLLSAQERLARCDATRFAEGCSFSLISISLCFAWGHFSSSVVA